MQACLAVVVLSVGLKKNKMQFVFCFVFLLAGYFYLTLGFPLKNIQSDVTSRPLLVKQLWELIQLPDGQLASMMMIMVMAMTRMIIRGGHHLNLNKSSSYFDACFDSGSSS